ncbi:MAG TPA: MCP four helix bundle domain-containing protein, partial [Salinarimonas sp.]|nr:MCP four helix bundle domain-containing protein [Salinarimonas sp.]
MVVVKGIATIRARLLISLLSLSVLLAGLAAMSWTTLSRSDGRMRDMYEERVVPLRSLKTLTEVYMVGVVDTANKLRTGALFWPDGLKAVQGAEREIQALWSAYKASRTGADEAVLITQADKEIQAAGAMIARFKRIIESQSTAQLTSLLNEGLYEVVDPVRESLTKLADNQLARARASFDEAHAAHRLGNLMLAAGLALGAAAVAYALFTALVQVIRPLGAMTGLMARLAQGDLSVPVVGADRRDEIGSLARSLQVFKDNALEARRLAEAERIAAEATTRRARALDALANRFETNVLSLNRSLSSAAADMEETARSMATVAEITTGRS